MPPTLAELMAALPEGAPLPGETAKGTANDAELEGHLKALAERIGPFAPPSGALRRMSVLGTLTAKVAAAYLFYWVRGWFHDPEARARERSEAHLRAALEILDAMSYLRGAAMKLGQFLGSLPEFVPDEFARVFSSLCFEAPPMHHALSREVLHDELGKEPEESFASFEPKAFAAASLGQVHRARLKSGEEAAVKVQYPGIARAIRSDLRLFTALLLPVRLGSDGESFRRQMDYLRGAIERETDYEREAEFQERARTLFRDEDGIVVPRVFAAHSTKRVLCMEFLDGVNLEQFLAGNPSQEERNRWSERILRAWYRILYAGRMHYVDWNPANFLFLRDGRLGLLDFGCMIPYTEEEWELLRRSDRPLTTGRREDRMEFLPHWAGAFDDQDEAGILGLIDAYLEWSWRPRWTNGPYDFGEAAELRRGFEIFNQLLRRRCARGHPSTALIMRWEMAFHSLLYRLGARVDVRRIAEEEIQATGWDRRGYCSS